MTGYTSVKVPKALAETIVASNVYKKYGYRSVSEFVIESTRLELDKIKTTQHHHSNVSGDKND